MADAGTKSTGQLEIASALLEELRDRLAERADVVRILEADRLLERVRAVSPLPSGHPDKIKALADVMTFQRAVRRWLAGF